jgi:hypothetical protein
MSHTKQEIYLIFFFGHWLKTEYFKTEGKVVIKELKRLANTINNDPIFLDNENDDAMSYRFIQRVLKFQDFIPKNLSTSKLNKLIRFVKQNKEADFKSTLFKNSMREELNQFKWKHASMFQEFFELFKDCKEKKLDKKSEVSYDFKQDIVKAIVSEKFGSSTRKNPTDKLEILIESLEDKLSILEENGLKAAMTKEDYEELGSYLNIWSDEKIEKVYKSILKDELERSYRKLEKAIQYKRYFWGIGLVLIKVDDSLGLSKTLFKKLEKELSKIYVDEYYDKSYPPDENGTEEDDETDIIND